MSYQLQLTVTEAQARLIVATLDLRIRVGIGQVEAVADVLDRPHFEDEVREHLHSIKAVLGHPRNGSHGIAHPKVSDATKTSYDLMKVVQKGVAVAADHGRFSVWHDGDILHLGTEPTARVAIVRGDQVEPIAVSRHQRRNRDGSDQDAE